MTANSQNFTQILLSANYSSSTINEVLQLSEGVITDVQNNRYLDITNAGALDHLNRLATKSYSNAGCSANLGMDSWVPNLQAPINCASGVPDAGNCSDLSVGGCINGCRGFTQQLGTTTNNQCAAHNCTVAGSVNTQLTARYGAGCVYTSLLENLNSNYDSTRQMALNTLKTNLNSMSGGF